MWASLHVCLVLHAAIPTLSPTPTHARDTNPPTWVRKPAAAALTNSAPSASLRSAWLPGPFLHHDPRAFLCFCRRFVPPHRYNLQLPYRSRPLLFQYRLTGVCGSRPTDELRERRAELCSVHPDGYTRLLGNVHRACVAIGLKPTTIRAVLRLLGHKPVNQPAKSSALLRLLQPGAWRMPRRRRIRR